MFLPRARTGGAAGGGENEDEKIALPPSANTCQVLIKGRCPGGSRHHSRAKRPLEKRRQKRKKRLRGGRQLERRLILGREKEQRRQRRSVTYL